MNEISEKASVGSAIGLKKGIANKPAFSVAKNARENAGASE